MKTLLYILVFAGLLVFIPLQDRVLQAQSSFTRVYLQSPEVRVFPNPAAEELNIQFLSDESGILELKLYNALGSAVIAEKFSYSAGNVLINVQLDRSKVKGGMYYISLETKNLSKTMKLIVR